MREISVGQITDTVADLFKQANYNLSEDVLALLQQAAGTEESIEGRNILDNILENAKIAAKGIYPLCQDCGTGVVFLELGQDVHITGGDLNEAVNLGVKQAYTDGYLRKSLVKEAFSSRLNTQDNTPAVIHVEIVHGDKLKITVFAKGGGAENMSRLGMLTPAAGKKGIIDFVVNSVSEAGSNPCPPLIVGVGIGGTAETTLLLAKKSLLRRAGTPNPDKEIAELEQDIFKKINALGIGPMGYGGRNTALAVHIEAFPSHLASLPVAVNLNCHSSRHKTATI
jgi:fumarate hydratase subunit alpha